MKIRAVAQEPLSASSAYPVYVHMSAFV